MSENNFESPPVKIERVIVWILLAFLILYMISGYGLTRGLVSHPLVWDLHAQWLPLIIVIAFALYVGLALRSMLIRRRTWNAISKTVLVLACLILLGFFVYVELCHRKEPREESDPAEETLPIEEETVPVEEDLLIGIASEPDEEENGLPVFTLEELSSYDGKDGRPAYVAVDGIVYDNTEVFKGGKHYSHFAGKDLTEEFYSYHIIEELEGYSVVGRLAE